MTCLTASLVLAGVLSAQDRKKMPREDVVEVPAIGEGLCLSNVFQAGMVLQRDQPVTVWGWAKPGDKVTVSLGEASVEGTAGGDRLWEVSLPAMEASTTPVVMTVKSGGGALTLDDILIGDVWVLGGQSNMEFDLAKVNDGELEIVSANFPQIRLLTVPQGKGFDSVRSFERLHEWSSWSSRHFQKGEWLSCTPETVGDFSAIGYVFGRRLHMASQVPIGLIDASVGGTTVETWTPEEVLKKIKGEETQELMTEWAEKIAAFDPQADLENEVAKFERWKQKQLEEGKEIPADRKAPTEPRPGPVADKNRPGHCYAGMIRPLKGLRVKGAIFHQGFNNCFSGSDGAKMYAQVFPEMVTAWRAAFGDPQMPFGILSLCTAGEPQTKENFLKPMFDIGAMLREAQYQTFVDFREAGDETIGFASTFDFRKSWYHPQIKVPAGERIAKWALATQYGLMKGDEHWLPPAIEEVVREDGTIRLKMSTQITTADDSDGEMLGFAIAGEDRRFYPAEISYYTDGSVDNRNRPKYQKDILVLSSPFVSQPVHYRHAWARNPMTNLTNSKAIPIATQRSDNWLPEETPLKFPVPPGMDEKSFARQMRGKIQKELQLADTERQIKEAERTIEELKEQFEKDEAAWEEQKAKELEKIKAAQEAAG